MPDRDGALPGCRSQRSDQRPTPVKHILQVQQSKSRTNRDNSPDSLLRRRQRQYTDNLFIINIFNTRDLVVYKIIMLIQCDRSPEIIANIYFTLWCCAGHS